MKILLPVLLLSAMTACSKQVSQPATSENPQPIISQESKHGYELAKAWNSATVEERKAEAEGYYTSGLTRFGKTESELAHLKLDLTTYEVCVTDARLVTACASPTLPKTAETTKACAGAGELGPKHIAECDKLIDELPKLIERQHAAIKEELKQ